MHPFEQMQRVLLGIVIVWTLMLGFQTVLALVLGVLVIHNGG